MTRGLAAVHHLDALRMKPGLQTQGKEAIPERTFRERSKFVEERHDEDGREHEHEELEGHHAAPGPEPPGMAGPFDKFENKHEKRITDYHAQCEALQAIHEPELRRGGVKPKPFLEMELV